MDRSSGERLSVGVLAKPTTDQVVRARRTVVRDVLNTNPDDPDAARADCTELLAMLGLLHDPSQ